MLQKAIIGKKVGMTQIFNADGKVIPCTVIEAGPCVVTQLKTEEKTATTQSSSALRMSRSASSTSRRRAT